MPRTVRQARNRALFRAVNDQIALLVEGRLQLDDPTQLEAFICECNRLGCTEPVRIAPADYQRVRDDPTTFLVAPGHVDRDHEHIVADHGDYLIVRLLEK